MIRLANPYLLLVGILFLPFFVKGKTTFLGYSRLGLLEAKGGSRLLGILPKLLSAFAIALLVIALSRPQWRTLVKRERFLARDILLVIDLSYSMENNLKGRKGPRKIDAAKKAALRFIAKRKGDRIGLLVFGDKTFGSWPLTRDLDIIARKVDRLGSTFYGGTNLVDPFLKGMDHFREMGQSANRILVFLSDGEASIPTEKKEAIISEMEKMDIHLYLLGINLRKENSDLLEIVDRTGGRFIPTESHTELVAAFNEIDRLEPGMVEVEIQGQDRELYPGLVAVALGLMLLVILLRNTLFIELC
ncbi:MAG: VWA domain-containing protein [Deltaproteobacteria bacterium]|nr:VWA domain-containing protein [Deltaproteobacteria bacterium]MBW2120255.1 VWA domain-containing protein [Deltaproteobacteria bacterium]